MQLKYESLSIFFMLFRPILAIRILFKSNSSKDIVMFVLNNVKSRSLVSNKSLKSFMSEGVLRASVEQGQIKVHIVKPGFKMMPVLLNINQQAVWLLI